MAYRCRAYPNPEQQALSRRTFGCVRLVWNRSLAERQIRFSAEGKSTSYAETDRALTGWKKTDELTFLNEVSAVPPQRVLRHQHAAFANFYAGRARYPRFKSRHARADHLHRTTARLVREHDVIVIEDLAPANMVKNRHPAKSIHDASRGGFRRQLEYKARWAGRRLIVIDRFYPSSKTCSDCGYLFTELSLSTRAWKCPGCRARHDRDHNAAKNILAAGRVVAVREHGDACGADVIRQGSSLPSSVMKQEPSPRPAR